MNFITLYPKELKLLFLNKLKFAALLFPLFFLVNGCGGKNQEPSTINEDYLGDNHKLLQHLQNKIDPEIKAALYSQFDNDSTKKEILTIKETKPSKTDKWGLKIERLSKDSLVKKDEFFLPEMSTNESICTTQKIDGFPYDLFYYNSGSFYTGSSGGEIFGYLLDFSEKQTYYAHLIIKPEKPVMLFLSKNCEGKKTKDFFLNLFKLDYPELVLSQKDIPSD